jgi:flagellar assembly protein FliH
MSKVISKDRTTAYERWEMPSVDDEQMLARYQERYLTADAIEKIQKQAYEEGFEQGKRDGLVAGKQAVEQTCQRLDEIMRQLSAPLDEVDESVVQQLVELTSLIANQVIRRELRTDPGQVVGVVRDCIKSLPIGTRKIQLYLHPEDAQLVREAFSLAEDVEANWQIVEDPVLVRGGCRLEADNSKIDATVEQQINRVVATVLGGEREADEHGE